MNSQTGPDMETVLDVECMEWCGVPKTTRLQLVCFLIDCAKGSNFLIYHEKRVSRPGNNHSISSNNL